METLRRLAGTMLTVCSGIGFGVTAMTGVVAAVVFPTMKELGPSLPAYAAHGGPHWSLAAGMVAERVFNIGFAVTGAALLGAMASVLVLAFTRGRREWPVARLALLFVTTGIFLTHFAWLQPRMDSAAAAYRKAAAAGRADEAAEAKGQFDDMHPIASKLIGGVALSSLALFVASSWTSAAALGRGSAGDA
ncbi:MAG TPA: hypothetical protein VFF69_10805 [Phycisphaerales bacterium]|nr:hypothetical protein [Phycisphaerales bacterium]